MNSQHLDATFAALADPTRRAILARLTSGEASGIELAKPFAMNQPAISKHLKVLERAGLISRGRDAQRRPRRVEPQRLAQVTDSLGGSRENPGGQFTDWLERYRKILEGNFQRLDSLLNELQPEKKKRKNKKR